MLVSLLIKLGMVALTMGVILWIGWATPQRQAVDRQITAGADGSETGPSPKTIGAATTAQPAAAASRSSQTSRTIRQLDLNQATEQDLEALPGIGPVLAGRIVEYRQIAGSFTNVEDLRAVKGIGKKTFERIRTLVKVIPSTGRSREGKRTT